MDKISLFRSVYMGVDGVIYIYIYIRWTNLLNEGTVATTNDNDNLFISSSIGRASLVRPEMTYLLVAHHD